MLDLRTGPAHLEPMAEAVPILVITGQTAGGKERLAVEVAARLGGEILSADSMKVYRGMDIGTAKPSAAQRASVPHHLLDVADPGDTFSTARWLELAEAAIADVQARGRAPVVSGGTPLYLKALLEGLFEGPSADEAIRARLRDEAEARGTPALHERLSEVDPEAAERIHPNDLRRIVRALEVWELTGTPISELQGQWGSRTAAYRPLVVAIRRDSGDLARRIAERVGRMLDAGLIDEVRALAGRREGFAQGPRQALGYAEALEFLDGRLSEEELAPAIIAHTRQFARRQMTWLKRFDGIEWLDAAPDADTDTLADRVIDLWRQHTRS
ncbi:MAG TPA: tRNA (adenosine(37)-N6)-dimethylallyltransferase MiaA [Phycisphaerae bacterium]|nr:tRNA (adenosine(37)-N6)-dimethylallyltransferase MiaA [Phycisphaerae bacterium]